MDLRNPYAMLDPGSAVIEHPDGIAVVPTKVKREGGVEWSVWLLVVAALVVLGILRRSFRGLIPGT